MNVDAIDLHMHSDRSDGHDAPLTVAMANRHLGLWSLTDHDTISGWRAIHGTPGLICGVEVTAANDGHEVHIVALGIDPDAAQLRDLLSENCRMRRVRLALMIARLPDHVRRGLTAADFAGHPSDALSRSHIARAIVKRGGEATMHAVFANWLGDEHCRDPEINPFPAPEQVCAAIAAAGGVAILAHPAVYADAQTALATAAACGAHLHGIELDSPRCTGELYDHLAAAASAQGWLVSRGSDRHRMNGRPLAERPAHPGLLALIERLAPAA